MQRLRQILSWLQSRLDGRDLTVGLSLCLIAGGLALVYVPAALVIPGALLFWLAVYPLLRAPGGET